MFCAKCGAKNEEGAVFCKECGASLKDAETSQNPKEGSLGNGKVLQGEPDKSSRKNRLIGMAAVGIVAVVAVLALVSLFGGRGYKTTAEKFIESCIEGDAKTMYKMVPQKIFREEVEDNGYLWSERNEYLESVEESVSNQIERYFSDYGDFSFKAIDGEKKTGRELRELKEEYESKHEIKVKAARDVTVEMTLKKDGVSGSAELVIPVIKVGRSWYVDIENITMGNVLQKLSGLR